MNAISAYASITLLIDKLSLKYSDYGTSKVTTTGNQFANFPLSSMVDNQYPMENIQKRKAVRLYITVSDETNKAVREYLIRIDKTKKGDFSRFVEDAILE